MTRRRPPESEARKAYLREYMRQRRQDPKYRATQAAQRRMRKDERKPKRQESELEPEYRSTAYRRRALGESEADYRAAMKLREIFVITKKDM